MLNDASRNDLAFKDPRQVVSNGGICTKSKHSILDMIYRLSKLEAVLKRPHLICTPQRESNFESKASLSFINAFIDISATT